jgi:hypothetical protein
VHDQLDVAPPPPGRGHTATKVGGEQRGASEEARGEDVELVIAATITHTVGH